jgi:hypothetical protein
MHVGLVRASEDVQITIVLKVKRVFKGPKHTDSSHSGSTATSSCSGWPLLRDQLPRLLVSLVAVLHENAEARYAEGKWGSRWYELQDDIDLLSRANLPFHLNPRRNIPRSDMGLTCPLPLCLCTGRLTESWKARPAHLSSVPVIPSLLN